MGLDMDKGHRYMYIHMEVDEVTHIVALFNVGVGDPHTPWTSFHVVYEM